MGITEAKMETMNHLVGIHNIDSIRQTYFKPFLFLFIFIFLPNNTVCPSLTDLSYRVTYRRSAPVLGRHTAKKFYVSIKAFFWQIFLQKLKLHGNSYSPGFIT